MITETFSADQETAEGTKTFDRSCTLPYVPAFDAKVTVKYRLWKNDKPPVTAK